MTELAGSRVLVVGLGISGASAAAALARIGADVRVTESEAGHAVQERARRLTRLGIEVEIGGHDLSKLDADLAVVSPGIPPSAPVLDALAGRGIEVIGEVELAYRLARCDFLAVTGTNGKTTTTSLLAAILREAGIPTAAAGNIGFPLVDAVSEIPDGGAIAVEVSSFQLAATRDFKPRVAILLNVAEDHTDWHTTVSDYIDAKARIVANQGPEDVFLPNLEDEAAMRIAASARSRVAPFSAVRTVENGIGVEAAQVLWAGRKILATDDVPLAGRAGLDDAIAAAGAALEYGVDERAVAGAITAFRPLAHRLEVIAEAGGITYIDDSKATNPHATLSAVNGLSGVVLIAGGRSKGIDLSVLASSVPAVVAVVALGEARGEVAAAFSKLVPVDEASSMDEAVRLAARRAPRGGSVLLSPGCASLDMYESYAARGEDFARAVRALNEMTGSNGDGREEGG